MNKNLLLLLGLLLSFTSCNTVSYFTPAAVGTNIAYLPKPMASDSIKFQLYASGSIAGNSFPYGRGSSNIGYLNVSGANTFKNFNVGYGVFGGLGEVKYDNQYGRLNTVYTPGYRMLNLFGLRSSVGLHIPSGRTDFRILNLESALSFEGGAYQAFRKKLYDRNEPDILSSNRTTLFSKGISSEIIWHAKSTMANQFGIRLFLGSSGALQDSYNQYDENLGGAILNYSFFFKVNHIFGIVDFGASNGASGRLSLGYSF